MTTVYIRTRDQQSVVPVLISNDLPHTYICGLAAFQQDTVLLCMWGRTINIDVVGPNQQGMFADKNRTSNCYLQVPGRSQTQHRAIRHPIDKSSVLSQASRQIYIRRKYKIPGTYAVYSCVWGLWVVFLERGGEALGIFKSPVCTYNQPWTFLCPLHTIFASWARVAARGAKRLVHDNFCLPSSQLPAAACLLFVDTMSHVGSRPSNGES